MTEKNKKDNILVILGLLIIAIVNILDIVIELNEFIEIGLYLIVIICSIIYLVKINKNKKGN